MKSYDKDVRTHNMNIVYIQSMNSDGAGSYEVIWKVEKAVYKERYIACGFYKTTANMKNI